MSLISNKKVYFDYEILEKMEAGIELLGIEVKSLRLGRGKLEGAHVIVRGTEVLVVGMEIPPYQAKNTPASYDPARNRRLLLTHREIGRLTGEGKSGKTVVPIALYLKGKKIKIEIAIARGKKKYDKRETIKRREADREVRRAVKHNVR